MVHQIKRQNVRLGYHKILLLQRVIAKGPRGGQNPGHPPDAFERNEPAGVGNTLLLTHLLRFVVKGQRDGVALEVTHDAARISDVRHDQLGVVHYRDQRRRSGEVGLDGEKG